jgi:hypothetical protein
MESSNPQLELIPDSILMGRSFLTAFKFAPVRSYDGEDIGDGVRFGASTGAGLTYAARLMRLKTCRAHICVVNVMLLADNAVCAGIGR